MGQLYLSARFIRHRLDPQALERFRYCDCYRVFQLAYAYEAHKADLKQQLTDMLSLAPVLTL